MRRGQKQLHDLHTLPPSLPWAGRSGARGGIQRWTLRTVMRPLKGAAGSWFQPCRAAQMSTCFPLRLLVSNCSEDSRHGPAVGGLPPVILSYPAFCCCWETLPCLSSVEKAVEDPALPFLS
jgi:hypothetical protein